MSHILKDVTGALPKYEKYLNNSTGRAWRGAISKDMEGAVSIILVGKKTPKIQSEPKVRISLRDEEDTQKVRISYEDASSRTSKVKEIAIPTSSVSEPGLILKWVLPYIAESITESMKDISDDTKKLIAMAIPAYETYLKKATKKTWRGLLMTQGKDTLYVKMLGKKSAGDITTPQLITRIKYDPAKDLFNLKETFVDGQVIEHKVKEVDGIGIETILDPMAFYSWVAPFMEMYVKGKRLKKTDDTKALAKASNKAAALESVRTASERLLKISEALEEDKWIQKAIKHPGALHKQLGVPEDEPIPADKLKAAAKAPGKLGKRARLALTLKKISK